MNTDELWVICQSPLCLPQAQTLAEQLGQSLKLDIDAASITQPEFVVVYNEQGVSLQQTGRKAPGPIRAEFAEGSVDHRRKFGGGKGQMIAKAVGVKAGVYPMVLDATAGLGKDAFVLATLGCQVQMLERSPVVHSLLADGLERARNHAVYNDPELAHIVARMELLAADSQDYLASITDENRPDVIYLDPMFPDRQKSADVKKEMAAFHHVVGKDEDADSLLEKALEKANYRVVVKRPRKAPFIANKTPSYQLEGKSSRYDIYTIKKMPERLGNL
ncbi:ribosomal RNA small subunit methyltransferase J [Cellvibrio zantedeschiae]|uniref:Ribosomal RNA small subunit methyltransferase J n=1 Tax=Cellvibrio zantedeschiae TaxID=1237077 RepID=A0ABQ3AWP7_9GAMM|nr:class I SAM-dependent methyltransferase [Cellvibrio zantedeschiae]GGY66473.1 ribosomal RNA small subunit methyltransferase J [Cellvibrio zantedeschiae]